jgi:hypothetical protein
MNSNEVTEVRFTAKRAMRWSNGNQRWVAINRDEARQMVALGQAVELKVGEWI